MSLDYLSIIFFFSVWVLYALIEGGREGFYWHYKAIASDSYDFDLHPFFAVQRGIVLMIMYLGVAIQGYLLDDPYYVIAACVLLVANTLLFSFFHNGAMYTMRNKLDKKIYPKKWFSQSTTSQAKLTFLMTPISRTIQMVLGVTLYIITLIYFI